MPVLIRRAPVAILAAFLAVSVSTFASAAPQVRQAPVQPAAGARAEAPAPPAPGTYVSPQNAKTTRQELKSILSKYSSNVGRVLALDPLLLQNPAFLQPYPELATFLSQHPEVAHNARYFFDEYEPSYFQPMDQETQMLRMWSGFFAGAMIFLSFCLVIGVLVWIIKTVVESRRWTRLLKAQTEAHNKVLDKFASHEDLLAYVSTPAGRRFLEAGPVMVNGSSASAGGPIRRILWATEVGLILVCGGGGLMFARGTLPGDIPQMMRMVALFIISLGIGFVLAAGASYLLSRRMGILGPAVSHDQRTTDAHPAE